MTKNSKRRPHVSNIISTYYLLNFLSEKRKHFVHYGSSLVGSRGNHAGGGAAYCADTRISHAHSSAGDITNSAGGDVHAFFHSIEFFFF